MSLHYIITNKSFIYSQRQGCWDVRLLDDGSVSVASVFKRRKNVWYEFPAYVNVETCHVPAYVKQMIVSAQNYWRNY